MLKTTIQMFKYVPGEIVGEQMWLDTVQQRCPRQKDFDLLMISIDSYL